MPVGREDFKERVNAELYGLMQGDLIEVKWLDACKTYNVKKLENKAFATYKVARGYFWTLKRDKLWGEAYLILYKDEGFNTRTIISIPLSTVVKVVKIKEQSDFLKVVNEAGTPYLAKGFVQTVRGVGDVEE